jgi:neutral trehalase
MTAKKSFSSPHLNPACNGPAWFTNNPEIAARLRKVDEHYNHMRASVANAPLADKVEVYRKARAAREASYKTIMESFT